MRIVEGTAVFSPSDLTGYLACDHLLTLELLAMIGKLVRPERDDPELAVLSRRGLEHETRYLDELRSAGRTVAVVGANRDTLASSGIARLRELHDRTVALLHEGPDVIYQGAEFLRRYRAGTRGRAKVVVISGVTNADALARRVTADEFIGKPFDVNHLTRIVYRLLETEGACR